ncbi:hypothetical protein MIR68_004474 [Amoeboaphelidium protococcarum]|nr:hypothetical protein MIR68_004474 [Amoeboaphelidium protococcarum]
MMEQVKLPSQFKDHLNSSDSQLRLRVVHQQAPNTRSESETTIGSPKSQVKRDHLNERTLVNIKDIKSEVQELRQKVSNVKSFLDDVTNGLDVVDQKIDQLQAVHQGSTSTIGNHHHHRRQSSKTAQSTDYKPQRRIIQSKVFKPRKSKLTELLEIKDFQTVYNIFVALLFILSASVIAQTYTTVNKLEDFSLDQVIDLSLFAYTFGKFDVVVKTWLVLFLYALSCHAWKYVILKSVKQHGGGVPSWLIASYATTAVSIMMFAGYQSLSHQLPPASGFIVMMEATRLSMKVHSYVRSMIDVALNLTDIADQHPAVDQNSFATYVYFLFVPTLLYRSSYPMTTRVRWSFVASRFAEVCLIMLYMYVIFKQYCIPQFAGTGRNPDSLHNLVSSLFQSMLPGVVVFVFGFFGLLHSWLNAWAEITRFADREFYKAWWNSHSFGEFYRLWNLPVHDWLYNYIYIDIWLYFEAKGYSKSTAKTISQLLVIEISAVIHEYIIACATGYFFPVLAFMFGGPGLLFTYLNRGKKEGSSHNVFFWAMMIIGNGMLTMLYSREYFARLYTFGSHQNVCGDDVTFGSIEYWKRFLSIYSIK